MIAREPPRGSTAPPELLARSGLEQVQAFVEGRVAPPPIHYLTGMAPTAVGDGTAEFQMPATGWLAGPSGYILGGTLAVLADGPLGSAIQSQLGPGTAYTTTELSMSYLRPALPDGRVLTATGRVLHAGRTLALSEVIVRDADGRDLAHGTSRCFVFPPADLPGPPPPLPAVDEPRHDTPAPFQRRVEGEVTPIEAWTDRSGLDVMRGWIDGDLPAPPISRLAGERPIAADEGSCSFAMPASGWLPSPSGLVEGGTLVMLADAALGGAVQTTLPPATAFAPVDITVKFIRPVGPDGRELVARARVVHRGRTIAVAEAHTYNEDGDLVTSAIGSTMILPGRDITAPVAPAEESAQEAEN